MHELWFWLVSVMIAIYVVMDGFDFGTLAEIEPGLVFFEARSLSESPIDLSCEWTTLSFIICAAIFSGPLPVANLRRTHRFGELMKLYFNLKNLIDLVSIVQGGICVLLLKVRNRGSRASTLLALL